VANIEAINAYIQEMLVKSGHRFVTAVEAARWLNSDGSLRDSPSRPGKPLRDLLRAGLVKGARQDPPGPHSNWTVWRVDLNHVEPNTTPKPPRQLMSTDEVGPEREVARILQREAAVRYRPKAVKTLLIAEAPPLALDRYFYFEEVFIQDALFWETMKVLYGASTRAEPKRGYLLRFQADGYFLIDALRDPVPEGASKSTVQELIVGRRHDILQEVRRLAPQCVILVKATVYDGLYHWLRENGVRVATARIPFPGSRWQSYFRSAFSNGLRECRSAKRAGPRWCDNGLVIEPFFPGNQR